MKKRLFVGTLTDIEQVSDIRKEVEALGIEGKWVEKENLHFTYRFLGSVEEDRISQIAGMLRLRLKGASAPTVTYRGLGVFPSLKAPKVLWIGLESDGLSDIKERIDKALAPFGFPPEGKFTPHLTLLRIKKMRRRTKFSRFIERMKDFTFKVEKEFVVSLIESRLTPEGPVYSVVEEFRLD